MKKSILIFLFAILHLNAQQEPIYSKFIYSNFLIDSPNDSSHCHIFSSSSYYPLSYSYQIWERNRITPTTIEGTQCVKVSIKHGENDENCNNNLDGNEDFSRAEIVFNEISNSNNIGWYKLRFYIPDDFKIDCTNSNCTIRHHIFQIHFGGATEFPWSKVSPTPPFLVDFDHENSNATEAKLRFYYGLEFRVKSQYITGPYRNCIACSLGSDGHADLASQYYGCGDGTNRTMQNYSVNYGWNEIVYEIKWSDSIDGYMNIYINTNDEYSNYSLRFTGPNEYKKNMFPLKDSLFNFLSQHFPDMVDNGYYTSNKIYHNVMKFGHYMYGPDVDSDIYFDYFLADSNNNKISSTYIINDGIVNWHQNYISCKPISPADSYVFYFEADGIGQYIGNRTQRLSLTRLFSVLDIDYYKPYHVAVRPKFNDGYPSHYRDNQIIEFIPITTLIDYQCDNTIDDTDILTINRLPRADGYVLFFQEVGNPNNSFYSGVGASGEISVMRLLQRHPNQLHMLSEYKVRVRASVGSYNTVYGPACTIMITPPSNHGGATKNSEKDVLVYPNPFKDNININVNIKQESKLKVVIYNQQGKQIKVLFNDIMKKGDFKTNWNITDDFGNKVNEKIYFCKVYINNNVITKKIINSK